MKNTISTRKKILFVLLFLYIFSPKFIFLPIDFSFLISLGAIILLCIKKEIQQIFSKNIVLFSFYIMISLLYLVNEAFHSVSFSTNSYSIIFIRQILEIIIPACCFTYYLFKYNINCVKYITIFLLIQIVSCIVMTNIDIKSYIFKNIIELNEHAAKFSYLRNFGIARNYLSWFPSCCSLMIFILFLDYCYNKKIQSLIVAILSNIILFLNSRTSILIELFCIITTLLYLKYLRITNKNKEKVGFTKKNILLLFFVIFLITSIIILYISLNKDFFDNIGKWLLQAIESIGSLFGKKYSGPNTFNDLNHFYLPDDSVSLVFGYGTPEYGKMHSDIGYVRYILYGGILISVILFIFYLDFFLTGYNGCKKTSEKFFLIVSYTSLLILQYKGEVFTLNEITRFLFLTTIYIGTQKKNNRKIG